MKPWMMGQQGMGLRGMRGQRGQQQVSAMTAMPAAQIPQMKRRMRRPEAMGLAGMAKWQQPVDPMMAESQRRQAQYMASNPSPTPFRAASQMAPGFTEQTGNRITTVQGSEIGDPNLQGPQVMRDRGDGSYAVGNNPGLQGLYYGDYGKYFT